MAMAVSQLVDIASQPRVTLRWEIVRMDALQGGKDRSVKQVSDGDYEGEYTAGCLFGIYM